MKWEYRIVRRRTPGSKDGYTFAIYRVYFENDEPIYCGEFPVSPTKGDVVGLLDELATMLESAIKNSDYFDYEYIATGGRPQH